MIDIDKIPYMKWITVPPNMFCLQNVLCTIEKQNRERYVEFTHVGRERCMTAKGVIAYMIIPHINTDRTVWKSIYMGDENPTESGRYVCCFEASKDTYERLQITKYWFDKRTQKFGGLEALGYMNVPKPYSGKKTLQF